MVLVKVATPRGAGNATDTYGRTVQKPVKDPGTGSMQPLHVAARDGDIAKLTELLEALGSGDEGNLELDRLAKCGWSPLIFAARRGHGEAVRLLTAAGASLTVVDSNGSSALHRAAHGNSPSAIEALIDAGAPLESIDRYGQTALHVAGANGSLRAAKCLVARGASPSARDGPLTDGMLPSEVAEMFRETETADYLKAALAQHQLDIKRASMSSKKEAQEWLKMMQSKR